MILLRARTAANHYPEVADELCFASKSIAFAEQNSALCAEGLKTGMIAEPCNCTYNFPQSWEIRSREQGEGVCSVQLVNVADDSCVGKITILVWKHKISIQDMISKQINQLKSTSHRFGKCPFIQIKPQKGFLQAAAAIFPLSHDGVEYEKNSIIQRNDSLIYTLTLDSAPRARCREWWAVNKRAFEIVRDSFQLKGQ